MSKINLPNKKKEIYLSRRKFDSDGNVIEKKCSNCKTFKTVENFFKDKNQFDGLYNNCKECHRLKQKEQYKKKKGISQSDLDSFFSGSMD